MSCCGTSDEPSEEGKPGAQLSSGVEVECCSPGGGAALVADGAEAASCCDAPSYLSASDNVSLAELVWNNLYLWIKSHKMLSCMILGMATLYFTEFKQFQESTLFVVESAIALSPFILTSILFVAWLNASGVENYTAKVFKSSTLPMIFLASAFGAMSPLCSCGVIPVILGLLSVGVPLAPVMAFWIASPIMDPEMFVLLVGGIGFEFAVAKTIIAFGMGVTSGLFTHWITKRGYFKQPLNDAALSSVHDNNILEGAPINWRFWTEPDRLTSFKRTFNSALALIAVSLSFAFFLESLMVAYIPAESIAKFVNGDSIATIFKAIVIGIPIYLNGYAAIPLVDRLMEYGMMPGVAMAFMIGGSVTSIPAIFAVSTITRKSVFIWYLVAALISTLVLSYLYQFTLQFLS